MKQYARTLSGFFSSVVLLVLILDSKTAIAGAANGLELCLRVIIPSLFPFFIVVNILNSALLGLHIPGLRAICHILRFPEGGESLLLLGLIGGYPVGAQLVADNWKSGQLSHRTAQILLGYCNNAGPAFIFGVTAALFSSVTIPLVLWLLHIFSALMTGFLLPRPANERIHIANTPAVSLVSTLNKTVYTCASICGWVILFKVLLSYLNKLLSGIVTQAALVHICGILELSNALLSLTAISSESERFILCAAFLSFGGLCVLMQTTSVTGPLGLGCYIPGKLMQTSVTILAASILVYFLYPQSAAINLPRTVLCIVILFFARKYAEKSCGNSLGSAV